jgi:hypothetical protein
MIPNNFSAYGVNLDSRIWIQFCNASTIIVLSHFRRKEDHLEDPGGDGKII